MNRGIQASGAYSRAAWVSPRGTFTGPSLVARTHPRASRPACGRVAVMPAHSTGDDALLATAGRVGADPR